MINTGNVFVFLSYLYPPIFNGTSLRSQFNNRQRGYGEFKDGWEFPGGKIEEGETAREAIVREIREELDTEIQVEEFLDTVEYDYPKFHLSMECFICTVKSGDLVLKEHEAAKWLTKETLESVEWLPADEGLIEKIREYIEKN